MSTTTSRRRLALLAAAGAVGAAVIVAPFATAATAASAIPSDLPRPGCFTLADAKGDSTESGSDIKSLVMRSTPTSLIGYVEMYTLGTTGSGLLDDGNHFSWGFTLNNHDIVADAAQTGPIAGLVRTILAQPNTTARIDGADRPDFKAESRFDTKTNTVVISIDRAAVEKATGGKLADDSVLLGLHAEAGPVLLVGLGQKDDTVSDDSVLPQAFFIGHSPCFGPAPAVIQVTGAQGAPSQSVANLEVRVVDPADGTTHAGRQITFTINNLVGKGVTDSNGYARTSMSIPLDTGYYSLVTTFAGDATAGEVRYVSQFVVQYRKTHMTMSYVDRRDGRLFTATVLDANSQGAAGQSVDWTVKGTSKATTKTDSAGRTQFLDRTFSREVKATYRGIPDRTAGCSAEFKY